MKNSLILLAVVTILGFTALAFSSKSEQKHDVYTFCEIELYNSSGKTKVVLVDGVEKPPKERFIKDEKGQFLMFNNIIEALNYMSEKGWTFVQEYNSGESNNVHKYLLKKLKD